MENSYGYGTGERAVYRTHAERTLAQWTLWLSCLKPYARSVRTGVKCRDDSEFEPNSTCLEGNEPSASGTRVQAYAMESVTNWKLHQPQERTVRYFGIHSRTLAAIFESCWCVHCFLSRAEGNSCTTCLHTLPRTNGKQRLHRRVIRPLAYRKNG